MGQLTKGDTKEDSPNSLNPLNQRENVELQQFLSGPRESNSPPAIHESDGITGEYRGILIIFEYKNCCFVSMAIPIIVKYSYLILSWAISP